MRLWELFVIALALSMDAFAVSVCKGLSAGRCGPGGAVRCGLWFGGFQALMPLAGFALGVRFAGLIERIDHWAAFFLLGLIGANMVREAVWGTEEADAAPADFGPAALLPLAVATSIDALAVGVTFAFLQVNILRAAGIIGLVTFALSAAGVWVGGRFGGRFGRPAGLAGGLLLIAMGCKVLLEHLGFLG